MVVAKGGSTLGPKSNTNPTGNKLPQSTTTGSLTHWRHGPPQRLRRRALAALMANPVESTTTAIGAGAC